MLPNLWTMVLTLAISFFQRVPKPLCVISVVPSSQRRMLWRHTDRPTLVSVPDSIPQTTQYYNAKEIRGFGDILILANSIIMSRVFVNGNGLV